VGYGAGVALVLALVVVVVTAIPAPRRGVASTSKARLHPPGALLHGTRDGSSPPGAPPVRIAVAASDAGSAGVAAAYGFPLWCLSVTIAADDPAYARADFNRARPCGRFDVYVTSIFHRIAGAWRLALAATQYHCPVAALPARVQTELGVCWLPR
jgi:hypothetical protein